ncbi:Alpha/Beta hydrolase protein [Mycena metata]|uniref:Alpha/Beta hydrolase protein n=1 Tax=Mycena metata TaxID=1033252 RepID=A0AAD7IXW9_9AGAR|nr:Alpha/Beta hydrolase protein [Mycena metata]
MSQDHFDKLPPELILLIAPYLPMKGLNTLVLACRRLREILQAELESRITAELPKDLLLWASNSKPQGWWVEEVADDDKPSGLSAAHPFGMCPWRGGRQSLHVHRCPFARPAVRFSLPEPATLLHGVQNATVLGLACPQQVLSPFALPVTLPDEGIVSEDCLKLSAFGFLASKEVGDEGITNLGLRDQIFALEWVREHMGAFGGDVARVVM